jgi:PAS domain-containing protein
VSEETGEAIAVFFEDKASRKEAFFNHESCALGKNGNRVCIQTTGLPVLDKDGRLKGFRGINKDITFTKKTAYALKEFENRFRSVMDYLNIGLTLISPDLEILSTNRTMDEMFPRNGLTDYSKCYHVYRNIHQNEPCPDCTAMLTLKDGQVHETTSELDTKIGKRFLRRISFPVINQQRDIIAAVVLLMNVTE